MRRKPLSGAIIGILIGASVAVILARLGVWPADQLTLFLLPALTGLLGLLILSLGRENSMPTMVVAIVILLAMGVWGALGFADVNQNGEMNGGCAVTADSAADSTTVDDTSRSDPFVIDPDGGLTWTASSPEAFTDYDWELHVVLGGISVPIESDTEANDAGDTENGGDVGDVGEYASSRGIDLGLYVGIYEVGGSAATCDGFGFVEIEGDGIDVIMLIAVALILLLVILLLILYFTGRSERSAASARAAESENIDITDALKTYEAGSEGPPKREDLG